MSASNEGTGVKKTTRPPYVPPAKPTRKPVESGVLDIIKYRTANKEHFAAQKEAKRLEAEKEKEQIRLAEKQRRDAMALEKRLANKATAKLASEAESDDEEESDPYEALV